MLGVETKVCWSMSVALDKMTDDDVQTIPKVFPKSIWGPTLIMGMVNTCWPTKATTAGAPDRGMDATEAPTLMRHLPQIEKIKSGLITLSNKFTPPSWINKTFFITMYNVSLYSKTLPSFIFEILLHAK